MYFQTCSVQIGNVHTKLWGGVIGISDNVYASLSFLSTSFHYMIFLWRGEYANETSLHSNLNSLLANEICMLEKDELLESTADTVINLSMHFS